ncbi:MAG: lysylphosphatidylglycerol synthase transmembrane domain-containing protein [Alphaproteobacteria bacterium]
MCCRSAPGDVIRALVFPLAIGVRRTTATASMMLERLIDLVSLLVCLGLGMALSPELHLPDWLKETLPPLAILAGMSIAGIVIFHRPVASLIARLSLMASAREQARIAKALDVGQEIIEGLGAMSHPRSLAQVLLLSLLVWAGEAGLFYALMVGLNLDAGPVAALMIMAITTLSTLVPSSPGYVGPFHLAAFSGIAMIGGSSAQGASFAILAHLSLWVPTTLAGAAAILTHPQLFKRAPAPVGA